MPLTEKKFNLQISVYMAFAVLLVLSAGIGISAHYTIKKQNEISRSLNHTYQVMNATDDIENLLTDMESNRRGLRCTHQKAYLQSYYEVLNRVAPALAEIDDLTKNDAQQSERVSLLEKHINDIVFFWSRLRLDESKYDSSENSKRTLEEKYRMDTIKFVADDILRAENSRQIQNEAANKKIIDYMSWSSPTGSFLLQAFIVMLIYLTIAELRKRKKAEAGLRDAINKEKQLSEMKSRFITMASHEFRTPLASILASTYLAAKYKTIEDQPKREKHFERMASAVHNLTEILDDMLSIDRLEAGKTDVALQKFNIEELITSLTNEIQPTLKPGQRITCEHTGPALTNLDPTLLKHILTNLVSNAIKFSKEGDPIKLTTYHNGKQLMISVKDNGIGIPKNDQDHLFDRFHRGANAATIEGTGLGLHIAAKYTRLMGGVIKYITEEGMGTELILTFPQTREDSVPELPGAEADAGIMAGRERSA